MHPVDSGTAARLPLLRVSAPGAPGEPDFGLLGWSPPVVGSCFSRSGHSRWGSKSFAARIHLIIWIADVEPDGRFLARGRRGFPGCAIQREESPNSAEQCAG